MRSRCWSGDGLNTFILYAETYAKMQYTICTLKTVDQKLIAQPGRFASLANAVFLTRALAKTIIR